MKFHESETIELKEIYTSEIRKETVAFANTKGGIIYIGVSDRGEIVGIDNADFVMQQLSNTLRDSIRPDISMFTNIEFLQEEDKTLLKITVNQGTKSPIIYLIKELSHREYILEVVQHLHLLQRIQFA